MLTILQLRLQLCIRIFYEKYCVYDMLQIRTKKSQIAVPLHVLGVKKLLVYKNLRPISLAILRTR